MKKIKVQIVLPECSEDEISNDLRKLTRLLSQRGHEKAMGLLGGEYGYGVEFENKVFMMHPYCWCEQDDCPWCMGCTCPESSNHYFVDGKEVAGQNEWMDFYYQEVYHRPYDPDDTYRPHEQTFADGEEINKRRPVVHDKICGYCRGEVGHGHNFLHKSSGSWIDWYKYIGRSMDMELKTPWDGIFDECKDSLRVKK